MLEKDNCSGNLRCGGVGRDLAPGLLVLEKTFHPGFQDVHGDRLVEAVKNASCDKISDHDQLYRINFLNSSSFSPACRSIS